MSRPRFASWSRLLPILLFAAWIPAASQDTRTVTEPAFPPLCATLTAQLQQSGNALPAGDESSFDTTRVQSALNACPSGEAVELAADASSGYNAFLIQPIAIPSGVTLLVDAGVTVYGSRNPADYDVQTGSCGIVASSSKGCTPLITINGDNAGVMGYGVIDGRGGQTLTAGVNAGTTWWQLAYQAQQKNENQYNPRLLQINGNNITLYKITLQNSPNFHVTYQGNGFTAWDVKIIAPGDARNTDGIDPGPAQNVTITNSYIGDGDDNIALKPSENPGGGPASDMSITKNHFYVGHGMSIGSQTAGGASSILVQNLNIDGDATNSNDTGIRIKSESSNGGVVSNVTYKQVCMQNVATAIQFNPYYDSTTGTNYPQFQNITLSDVTDLTAGTVQLQGYSATYPLGLTLDNVNFTTISSSQVSAENANITLGPGPVNFAAYISGSGVNLTNSITNPTESLYACSSSSFPLLAPEFFGSAAQLTPAQPLTLTAIFEPVREPNWESTSGQYSSTSAYYPVEPTGTVTFYDGSSQVGQATLSGSSDLATVTLSSQSVGSHNYTAVYSGDANYSPMTTAAFPVTVAYLPTTTTLDVSTNQVAAETPVTLTATVSSTAGGTPTGLVEFFSGTQSIGTSNLNSSGVAAFTTSALPAGNDSLTAQYQGDTTYDASTSAVQLVSVGTLSTTTTLSASAESVSVGQPVEFTATVTSSSGTPSGTVTFLNGSTALGSSTLNNSGVATFTTSSLAIGAYNITASYAASGSYAASVSSSVAFTVSAAPTVTTLTSSAATINAGQSVTLTATLTSTAGTPAGTVTFLDGSTTLGIGTLNSNGVATYTVASLAAGSHTITASYAATGSFAASTSSPLTIAVQGFSIAASETTLNIAPGSSASTTLTFTAAGGLAGTISYSCSGLPSYIACSFSPASASLSGGTATTVLTFSVASTISGWLLPVLPLLGFLPTGGKRRRRWAMVAIAALGIGLTALTGCGGGGSSSASTTQPPPAGQQTATVTATTTTAAGTITSTQQITVNVQ